MIDSAANCSPWIFTLPVRFEVTLTETQKLSISVPGKLGEQSQVLEMSHVGTKLVIAPPQTPNDKLIWLERTLRAHGLN